MGAQVGSLIKVRTRHSCIDGPVPRTYVPRTSQSLSVSPSLLLSRTQGFGLGDDVAPCDPASFT